MKLTETQIAEILDMIKAGKPYKSIARKFKISDGYVSQIRHDHSLPPRRTYTKRNQRKSPTADLHEMKQRVQLEATIKKCLLEVLIHAGVIK